MRTPCYGCQRREANCHSSCQEYLEFDSRRKEQLHNEKKTNPTYAFLSNRSESFRDSFK